MQNANKLHTAFNKMMLKKIYKKYVQHDKRQKNKKREN